MTRLPQSRLVPLDIIREEGSERAALALAEVEVESLWGARAGFLHDDEERYLQRAGVRRRQADYLRGRYCAKQALRSLRPDSRAQEVCVANGVFGQPVVRGRAVENVQISIAHSGRWAAALAFEEAHPMAIDIEAHDVEHEETIRREVRAAEIAAFERAGISGPTSLTLLWAAKESLAKVLRTGLMAPLSFYDVGSVERTAGGAVVCEFHHFAQYKSYCAMLGELAVAIALPRKSFLQLDWRAMTVEPR